MKPSDIVGIDEIADADDKVILKKVFTIYKCSTLHFSTVKVYHIFVELWTFSLLHPQLLVL